MKLYSENTSNWKLQQSLQNHKKKNIKKKHMPGWLFGVSTDGNRAPAPLTGSKCCIPPDTCQLSKQLQVELSCPKEGYGFNASWVCTEVITYDRSMWSEWTKNVCGTYGLWKMKDQSVMKLINLKPHHLLRKSTIQKAAMGYAQELNQFSPSKVMPVHTLPHFLQWCFLRNCMTPKRAWQCMHTLSNGIFKPP